MDSSSPLEQALADRDRALELLRGSERRARRIIETAGDAFVSMGSDGVVEAWNGAAEVTFGWRADEAIGRPLHELIIPPEQRAGHLRGLERMRAGGQASILGQTLELTALRRDGGELPVELTVWAIDDDDRRSFNAFVRDISARRRDEEALKVAAAELGALNCELSLLSRTDPLTGTSNRRHIDEVLAAACQAAQRHDDSVAVLLIDIDHFKQVNDHHGHRSGDDVLEIVTRRLASAVRTEDTLGRWGGEEFIAVLPRTDQAAAVALAERLRSCVADEPVPVGDEDALRITISIGVASATHPVPERLVADADRAMYSAKENGRNRVA